MYCIGRLLGHDGCSIGGGHTVRVSSSGHELRGFAQDGLQVAEHTRLQRRAVRR